MPSDSVFLFISVVAPNQQFESHRPKIRIQVRSLVPFPRPVFSENLRLFFSHQTTQRLRVTVARCSVRSVKLCDHMVANVELAFCAYDLESHSF